jgi:hypothetical protein
MPIQKVKPVLQEGKMNVRKVASTKHEAIFTSCIYMKGDNQSYLPRIQGNIISILICKVKNKKLKLKEK